MTDVLTNIPHLFRGYVNIALSCVVISVKHALIFISMFAQARVRVRIWILPSLAVFYSAPF